MVGQRPAVSIVIPTYNERDNISSLHAAITQALGDGWQYELIFVDDNSPDGTAEAIQKLGAEDTRIRLLQRPGKLGLGSAVTDGFSWAQGDYWVMMDADLSHQPRYLPALLDALQTADIAVGSRYVASGGVEEWPAFRRLASRVASQIGRWMVGIPTRDLTSGFAAFRRQSLEPLLPHLDPRGFKLLLEVLAKSRGAQVTEVPIRFVDRAHGRSKFSSGEVLTYLRLCWRLRRGRL